MFFNLHTLPAGKHMYTVYAYSVEYDATEEIDLVEDARISTDDMLAKANAKVTELLEPGCIVAAISDQSTGEFIYRAEVLKPIEIVRQATTVAARILRQEGRLGVVAPGALADLILVDGNPLRNLELFLDQGAHLPVSMKAGKFHKNALG